MQKLSQNSFPSCFLGTLSGTGSAEMAAGSRSDGFSPSGSVGSSGGRTASGLETAMGVSGVSVFSAGLVSGTASCSGTVSHGCSCSVIDRSFSQTEAVPVSTSAG